MCADVSPGMMYADDAGIVSRSAEGLAKMMTVIVTVFEAAGLTVSEKYTETKLLRTLNQVLPISLLVVEAAGQRYMQTMRFLYLCGLIDANADIMPEIKRRIRLAWACHDRFKCELYDTWYRGCPVHLKDAPAKYRDDGDPAVRVCDLGSRPGALRQTLNGTPQPLPKDHWVSAPTAHRPPHAVRQGSQESTM